MLVNVRSFAKINLGLCIGPLRADGFHELRTVYQTIALHDMVRAQVVRGTGIEIRCDDPRVPRDRSNTCYRIVDRAMAVLRMGGRVVVDIEKRLPVQGGLGGASANAVAAMLGLERALRKQLPAPERLRIAAEVGSDLPLFLVGGTVLGTGHGEEVYPLPDIPQTPLVIATPEVGVSTPRAFAEWDSLLTGEDARRSTVGGSLKLTATDPSDRINEFGRAISAWLSGNSQSKRLRKSLSGVPANDRGRPRSCFSTLSVPGSKTTLRKSSFLSIPNCAR